MELIPKTQTTRKENPTIGRVIYTFMQIQML